MVDEPQQKMYAKAESNCQSNRSRRSLDHEQECFDDGSQTKKKTVKE